jgi:zinc protease
MLLRGGGGLNAKGVIDVVDQLNLKINANATWDSIDFVVTGPPDSLDEIIDLIARLIIKPDFLQKELDDLKSARTADLQRLAASEAEKVRLKTVESVFGQHPFGRSERGAPESLSKISRADLEYFHSRFFIANNAQLAVTGNTTMGHLSQLARTKLGIWKKGVKVPPNFRPPETHSSRRIILLNKPKETKETAVAAIGQVALSRRAADYYAAAVMAEVLRDSGDKLARSAAPEVAVDVKLEQRYIAGPLLFEIRSPVSDVTAVVESLITAMSRFREGQISVEQIEAAKQRLLTRYSERVSNIDGITEAILDVELYGLGRDYLIRFPEWIKAVTLAEVKEAARKYLTPESLSVVVSAPAREVETGLKKLGTVTVVG